MTKDVVKVFKRNTKDAAKKPQSAVNSPKLESDAQLKLVKVINNWIFERCENRRMEKAFSDGKISEWKILPEDLTETIS